MTAHYEVTDHVARVVIDRPARRNAIDRATELAMQRIWQEIEGDRRVRCVILTGAGDKAFCAGADIHESAGSGTSGLDYWAAPRPGGFGGIAARTSLNVPVVARVNGHAFGGGFEMVLGADIVVAVDEARFGLTEPRIGYLPLDGGMVQLPRQIPYHLAMGILLTGRQVPAAEMLRFGLINEVVAGPELDAAVGRWVDDILACSPASLRAIKAVVRTTAHLAVGDAMGRRLPALVEALTGPDQAEGAAAFRDKRAPVWSD